MTGSKIFFFITFIMCGFCYADEEAVAPLSEVSKDSNDAPLETLETPTQDMDCEAETFMGYDTDDPCYCPNENECYIDYSGNIGNSDSGGDKNWIDRLEGTCENLREWGDCAPLDFVLRLHAAKMKREIRLIWKGSKGAHDTPTDHLTMVYESCHAMDVEKSRKLLIYAVESLLRDLNDTCAPHPQLGHHPFCPKDLTVEIRFNNFFAQYVDRKHIENLKMEENIINYTAFDCRGPKACHTRKERYRDALDFVKLDLAMESEYTNTKNKRTLGVGVEKSAPWESLIDWSSR